MFDALGGFVWRFVFPDNQIGPAGSNSSAFRVVVALDIASKLLCPPAAVFPRLGAMNRARMPIATANIDDHSSTGEDNVLTSARFWEHVVIHAIAEPSRVQPPPKLKLGLGIAPTLPTHPAKDNIGGRRRIRSRRRWCRIRWPSSRSCCRNGM
jgi:hypothetical protein